jgi:hypothetical protein
VAAGGSLLLEFGQFDDRCSVVDDGHELARYVLLGHSPDPPFWLPRSARYVCSHPGAASAVVGRGVLTSLN